MVYITHNQQTDRQTWIDSAKAIGVILIILGHNIYNTSLPPYVNQIIYSFHVPLFFIISGYLQKQIINIREFLIKKFKRILIPYLCYAVIGIFTFEEYRQWNVKDCIIDAFYFKGHVVNNPLWFLVVLFEIYVVCVLIRLTYYNQAGMAAICIITFAAAWIIYKYPADVYNYFGFNRTVLCLGFFTVGMLARKIRFRSEYFGLLMLVSLITNFITVIEGNIRISIYWYALGDNYLLFLLSALSGSVAVIMLCMLSNNIKSPISSLCRYSILFLGTQYYVIRLYWRKIVPRLLEGKHFLSDIVMLILMICYMIILPVVFEALKKRIKFIKAFNGEL